MMLCQRCRRGMTPLRVDGLALRTCEDCGGRVAYLSRLRGRVPLDSLIAVRRVVAGAGGSDGRSCPACTKRMTLVDVPQSTGLLELDVCPKCQLVWFDRDEAEQLVPGPSAAKTRRRGHRARDKSMLTGPANAWQWVPAIFGMPWEVGAPAVTRRPMVTWLIAALTIAASVFAFFDLERAIREFGFVPDAAGRLNGLTLLTSFFVHAGLIHLLSNVYFLVVFGDNVEEALGPLRFLLLLLAATIGGALLHAGLDPRGDVPCIGASGGVSGVLAFYALRFPAARVGVMYWIILPIFLRFSVLTAFALWTLLQFLIAYGQTEGLSSVSGLAHLGGAAAGAAVYFLFGRPVEMD